MKKKITALFLAGVMVVLGACGGDKGASNTQAPTQKAADATQTPSGGNDNNSDNGGAAATEAPAKESYPDLGGYKFTLATLFPGWFAPDENLGTPLNSARMKVLEDIETNYNCVIEIIDLPPDSVLTSLQPAVFAGDKFADVIMTTHWAYGPLMGANLLLDLGKIETLDLSNEWWVQQISGILTVGGEVLGAAGSFTHPTFPTYDMFFNKRIWAELGYEDPYNLVRTGQWTWDKMMAFASGAKKDQNGDGNVDSPEDRWGIIAPGEDFTRGMFFSMGGQIYSTNPTTGRVELACNTPETYDKIEFMRTFMQTPGMITGGANWESTRSLFLEGHGLFLSCQVDTDLRDMEDDFGVLPLPKWNAAQTSYIGAIDHNGTVFGVPLTNRDLVQTGYILDALGKGFMNVDQLRIEEMEDTYYRSDEDAEMLEDYIKGTTHDDLVLFLKAASSILGTPMALIVSSMSMEGESDVASTMESIKEAVEYQIGEFFGYNSEE